MSGPLSLISTADLVEELQGRFEATIFCGVRPLGRGNDELFHGDWRGSLVTCIGLAERMRARLTKEALDSDPAGPDDEV